MEKRIELIKTLKSNIEHQGIGGKQIIIEFELDAITVFSKAVEGNWACYNFINRRPDFNADFSYKLYYGKVGGLGYVVAEDEFEKEEE